MLLKFIVRLALIAAAIGVVVAALMLWLGMRHNSQGEFYVPETNQIDLGYAVKVFAYWFLPVSTLAFAVIFAGARLAKVLRER